MEETKTIIDAANRITANVEGINTKLTATETEKAALAVKVAELTKQLESPNAGTAKRYTVAAGGDINAALKGAAAGSVVTVEPATYSTSLAVPAGVTLDLTGATIDGKGTLALAADIKGKVRGGTFTNFNGANSREAAVVRLTANGAELTAATIQNCKGAAISANNVNDITVVGNAINKVSGSWILAGGGSGFNVSYNRVDGYNSDKNNTPSGVGTNKFTRTRQMVCVGNVIKNGCGPALWWDIGNSDSIIANNVISGITMARDAWDACGIYLELQQGTNTVVTNNKLHGFDKGAAIIVAESQGVYVVGNLVDGYGRVELRNMMERDGANRRYDETVNGVKVVVPCPLKNVLIERNVFPNMGNTKIWLSSGYWAGVSPANTKPWKPEVIKYLAELNIVTRVQSYLILFTSLNGWSVNAPAVLRGRPFI